MLEAPDLGLTRQNYLDGVKEVITNRDFIFLNRYFVGSYVLFWENSVDLRIKGKRA